MGLDMYFYAKRYSSKSHWNEDDKFFKEYPEELQGFYEPILASNFASTEEKYQIGYFRKFNALHKYMCDLDGGVDECQEIYIGQKHIKELLTKLRAIKEDHSKAAELLPTQNGFFFGNTNYDEWYFQDVEAAITLFEQIDNFLTEQSHQLINCEGKPVFNDDGTPYMTCDWDICYRASW